MLDILHNFLKKQSAISVHVKAEIGKNSSKTDKKC